MVLTRKRARLSWKRGAGSQGEALYQALHSGSLAYLEVADMANALNVCRALRFDDELGAIALSATAFASHLGRRCIDDWTDPRPSFLQSEQALDHTQCEKRCSQSPTTTERVTELLARLDHRRGQHVGLLSALAMLQTRVLPLCYRDWVVNPYGDLCTVRPVLRVVGSESGRSLTDATRAALNDWSAALGDDFLGAPAQYTHVSDFGAHWETITRPSGRRNKQSFHCGLCDGAKAAVKEYRREARAALKRFQDILRDRKEEWRAEGLDAAEIHQRRSELKAEMFPDECYPDPNFAEGLDDEILADICESGRFPIDPFDGMHIGFERFNDDVFYALREECIDVCRELLLPLKQTLTLHCEIVGRRVHRDWMGDGQWSDEGEGRNIKGELLGGVTRAGVFCGVFLLTRRS